MQPVRHERSGWRDLDFNDRHRDWGFDCPATDIDKLFIEYNHGKASALVEYKHEQAGAQNMDHPTYQAMIDLANAASKPAFFVRYAGDFSWFRVFPMNPLATEWVGYDYQDLSERSYVQLLYRVRGIPCPLAVLDQLNDRDPLHLPQPIDQVDWAIRRLRASKWFKNGRPAPGYPYRTEP